MFGRKIYSNVILFAGAVFALLSACSNGTDTAGVISETESGKTIAGIVTDFDGNTIKGAKVALMRRDFIAVRDNPEMETTTDDSGKFSFEDIKSDSFNIQVSSDGLLDFRNILDITKPEDSVYRFEVSEGSNLKLELNAYDLALGDTICIDGSLNCFVVNSEDVDRGYILADGIPNAYFEKITIMTAEGETETDSVYWSFRSEDTLLVTRDKPGYLVGLRKMTFNDSVVATLKAMDAGITLKHIPILVESKSETGAHLPFPRAPPLHLLQPGRIRQRRLLRNRPAPGFNKKRPQGPQTCRWIPAVRRRKSRVQFLDQGRSPCRHRVHYLFIYTLRQRRL